MPVFLDTRGRSTLAIGICDRCKTKVPLDELHSDGDVPGLRVCNSKGCNDRKDPEKLPPRKSENISLKHPRPDEPVSLPRPLLP